MADLLLPPAALARLGRIQLQSRLPMAGTMSGHHRSAQRGASVEFAQYRKYASGDDIRLLDWRVFARTDRFYLKEFEADTNLRAYLVLDASASMAFAGPGGAGVSKLAYASRLVATLAYLLVEQGDAAGLSCLGQTRVEIPARRNPAHLRPVFEALETLHAKGNTTLSEDLHPLAEKIPARSLVLIFSDGFTDVEDLLRALGHLRFRRHDVAFFHLLHRVEMDFAFTQPTRFVDMESPRALLAEPEIIRRQYHTALAAFLDRLRAGCREHKVEYRRVVTDEDGEKVLAEFLIERARRK